MDKFLFWVSGFLPCRLIPRNPGQPYLERYWLFSIFGLRLYLHRFVAGDVDEEPHDHPWKLAISFVLSGSYIESRGHMHPRKGFEGVTRKVSWFNLIRGSDFHQIRSVSRETWTLFIHTPKAKPWGFINWVPGGGTMYMPPPNGPSEDWHNTVCTGRHADREPFQPQEK